MRSRRRVVTAVGGIAAGSILLGYAAGAQVISPADRAARTAAPPASPITAPVELRRLESQVVVRGDAAFAGAVDVRVETSELETPAVVSGGVPEVGATVNEGDVLLQVAGRPVLVLGGELPAYRTLRPGSTGPDVAQLEAVLERLGIDPGPVDDRYDQDTGHAVAELFERSGYQAPAPEATPGELAQAQAALASAEASVQAAQGSLAEAQAGAPPSEVLSAQADLNEATRSLADAQASGTPGEIAAAQDQLAVAQAVLQEAQQPLDTPELHAAVASARAERDAAAAELSDLQDAAGTPLPASEVVVLPGLPRRVDQVDVTRGQVIDGPVMQVSGAQLVIDAHVGGEDRQLLTEGLAAVMELGDLRLDGHVTAISRDGEDSAATGSTGDAGAAETATTEAGSEGSEAGFTVEITPDSVTPERLDALRDANVKVTIPVSATEGEVLAVPLAALTAGPGGQSRVEVLRGDETALVPVEVGLSAGGYAEIRPAAGQTVEAGDAVVVGRAG
ncbi:MAG TPA: peptidoglycan-binding protein [Acidimicrobiales bacterium]|nr:peptidoglycan-binding protein [Acidimicrobiales bacterium]